MDRHLVYTFYPLNRYIDAARFILWKGMKELVPLICDKQLCEDDNRLYELIRTDPRCSALRILAWEDMHHWFIRGAETWDLYQQAFVHFVVLDPEVLERYDADVNDGSARAWLWNMIHWACRAYQDWSNMPTFIDGAHWYVGVGHDRSGYPYFWDLDHLLGSSRGALPSLATLVDEMADYRIFMHPRWNPIVDA
ncbi:hypothetical protein F4823DRAFT_630448 [Ustulina deusta]|nr:hypothetical protein F4823DRAFT_630448 [Ustulina deusta]